MSVFSILGCRDSRVCGLSAPPEGLQAFLGSVHWHLRSEQTRGIDHETILSGVESFGIEEPLGIHTRFCSEPDFVL